MPSIWDLPDGTPTTASLIVGSVGGVASTFPVGDIEAGVAVEGSGSSGYTFEQDEADGTPTATAFNQSWFAADTGITYIWYDLGDGMVSNGTWLQSGTTDGGGAIDGEDIGAFPSVRPTDAASLNTLIAAYSSAGGVDLEPGVYDIDAPLAAPPSGFTLKGRAGVIFRITYNTPYAWLWEGTQGANITLDADQGAGAYTITLPTGEGAAFSVDDVIGIESADIVDGGVCQARQLFQVLNVTGDVISLDQPLRFDYTTVNSAVCFRSVPLADITVSDITIEHNTGVTSRGPILKRAIRCRFDNITIVNGPGVTFEDAINCLATNLIVDGAKTYADGSGYGVVVAGSGHGTVVSNSTFRATRHAATTLYHQTADPFYYTGPFNTTFANLIGWGGPESSAVFDTHAYAWDTTFTGCQAIGTGQGATAAYQDRGNHTQINGCTSTGSNRGIVATTTSRYLTASDCEVRTLAGSVAPVCLSAAGDHARLRQLSIVPNRGAVLRDVVWSGC